MKDDAAPVTATQMERLLQVALQPVIYRLECVEQKLNVIDHRSARSERDIDRILVIIGNIDQKFSSTIGQHERRIKRLEKKVGLAATA